MEGKGTAGSFVCSWPRRMAGHYSLSKFCPSKLVITLLTSVEPTLAPWLGMKVLHSEGHWWEVEDRAPYLIPHQVGVQSIS